MNDADGMMAETADLNTALERFESALAKLDAATEDLKARESAALAMSEETQALREDRARLADELDQVRATARALSDVNREAARRIDSVMTRVKGVLGESE